LAVARRVIDQWRALIIFSAAASIKWRWWHLAVWQSRVEHAARLVHTFLSHDAHHEYNENRQTSQMQHY